MKRHDLDWLLDDHTTVTRWSPEDKEYVSTFTEEDLSGLSGLGVDAHNALQELKTAYRAWAAEVISSKFSMEEGVPK